MSLQHFMSSGLFYNSLRCFSIRSHLTPLLPTTPLTHLPILTYAYQSLLQSVSILLLLSPSSLYPFLQFAPSPSHSLFLYTPNHICRFD
jgi:hypothetical protein